MPETPYNVYFRGNKHVRSLEPQRHVYAPFKVFLCDLMIFPFPLQVALQPTN